MFSPRLSSLLALALALAPPGRAEDRRFTLPPLVARALSADYRAQDDRLRALEAELLALPKAPKNERGARLGWKVFGYGDTLPAEQWVEIDLGATHRIDAIGLVPVDAPPPDSSDGGVGFPRRFRVELDHGPGPKTIAADRTESDFPNPDAHPVLLPTPGATARRVRVVMSKPWARGNYRAYALGEIMVLQGNRNLATGLAGVRVRTSGSFESGPGWSRQNLIDGQSIAGAPLRASNRPFAHGWESERLADPATRVWAQVDLGQAGVIDEVRLVPIKVTEYSTTHGYGFPPRFRVEVADEPAFAAPRLLADRTQRPFGDSAFSPITLPGGGAVARYVRVTAHELWQRSQDVYAFALAELQVYRGDANIAAGAPVAVHSVPANGSPNFAAPFLTDGLRGPQEFAEWPEWLGALSRRREALHEADGLRARLAALQPGLLRLALGLAAGLIALAVFGALASLLLARRRQRRALAGLQRRIAGDLHDEIGSNLASIAMLTELGQRQAAGLAAADLGEIGRLATESAAAMRDIVWLTQPGPHDAPQLAERLRAAAGRLLKGLAWTFEIAGLEAAPSIDVQRHLLLALKEMLNNVLRHAGAGAVEIRLTVRGGHFTLDVRDDGRGFDLAQRGDGHGFVSLRHRAALLRGELVLESAPGAGTRASLRGLLHAAGEAPAPAA